MAGPARRRHFATLGMFIIDEFSFADENGNPTGKTLEAQVSISCGHHRPSRTTWLTERGQIGGGGTYAVIGARIWSTFPSILRSPLTKYRPLRLPPSNVGMIIDRGHDFPAHIQAALDSYGSDMWLYRDGPSRGTTRAVNAYRGDYRGSSHSMRLIDHPADCYTLLQI